VVAAVQYKLKIFHVHVITCNQVLFLSSFARSFPVIILACLRTSQHFHFYHDESVSLMPNPQSVGPFIYLKVCFLREVGYALGSFPVSLWDTFIWLLCSDLSDLGDPTSSYATAGYPQLHGSMPSS